MNRIQYFQKRAKLLMQVEDAQRLHCKRVLAHAKIELQTLESNFKKEHLSNPLFSYEVTKDELPTLVDTEPTFKVVVTFKDGETYELMFWHEIKEGVKYSVIEEWVKNQLTKTLNNGSVITKAHFILWKQNLKWQIVLYFSVLETEKSIIKFLQIVY